MRPVHAVILVCLLLFLPGYSSAQRGSLLHEGVERTYLLHLPPAYDGRSPYPLVIAMHGGFGSAENLQRMSRLSEAADTLNFVVVYPEGVAAAFGIRTWNAGGCCGPAVRNNVDDVGFIAALIDTLKASLNLDLRRVYATGMSNGGMMAYRLACELSDRIAAIAPVAATLAAERCEPARPVPIIHFHSFLDENVPYQGGVGSGVSGFYNPPLDSVFAVWAELNACEVGPDTLRNDADLLWLQWSACQDSAELQLYLTHDGGHSWPGGRKVARPGADPPSQVIDANALMWDFFQAHTLGLPTSVGRRAQPEAFELQQNFPNPFNPTTVIRFRLAETASVNLAVYDLKGRVVTILLEGLLPAGSHAVTWDGRTGRGEAVAAGVYFYRLQAGVRSLTRKLVLLR